jgi:hypothetical protein
MIDRPTKSKHAPHRIGSPDKKGRRKKAATFEARGTHQHACLNPQYKSGSTAKRQTKRRGFVIDMDVHSPYGESIINIVSKVVFTVSESVALKTSSLGIQEDVLEKPHAILPISIIG